MIIFESKYSFCVLLMLLLSVTAHFYLNGVLKAFLFIHLFVRSVCVGRSATQMHSVIGAANDGNYNSLTHFAGLILII